MRILRFTLKYWLPLAAALTAVFAFIYLSVQQDLRMGLNDPQIQMAEDAASNLNAGASVESVVPTNKVDIAESLAPFVIIFDDSGKVLASSATLHGVIPAYPAGVLDYVRQKGQDRVTWQPEAGVRMATVVEPYKHGFVMAGRSLIEVEKRESQVESLSGTAMLCIWAATLIVIILGELVGH